MEEKQNKKSSGVQNKDRLIELQEEILKVQKENCIINSDILKGIQETNIKLDNIFKISLSDYVVNFPLSSNITYHKEEESLSYLYKEKIGNFITKMNTVNLPVKDAINYIRYNIMKIAEMSSQNINDLTIDWSGNGITAPDPVKSTTISTTTVLKGDLVELKNSLSISKKYLLSTKSVDEQLTQLYLDYTSYELVTKNLLQAVETIINEVNALNQKDIIKNHSFLNSFESAINQLKFPRFFRVFYKNNNGAGEIETDISSYKTRDCVKITGLLYEMNKKNSEANQDSLDGGDLDNDSDIYNDVSRIRASYLVRKSLNNLLKDYNSIKLNK